MKKYFFISLAVIAAMLTAINFLNAKIEAPAPRVKQTRTSCSGCGSCLNFGNVGSGESVVTNLPIVAIPISVGDTVIGSLTPGSQKFSDGSYVNWYEMQAQAGDTLKFTLASTNFDTFLVIRNSSGLDEQNDDISENNKNSEVVYTFRTTGIIRIGANSYEPKATGDYRLSVQRVGNAAAQLTRGTSLALGQTAQGSLAPTDAAFSNDRYYDQYYFNGTAGDAVVLSLNSLAFDAFLIVVDPNGNRTEIDDARGSQNPFIEFTLPASGAYQVYATSYDSGLTGAYTLSFAAASAQPATQPAETGARYFGVFAGISDYPGTMNDLNYCDKDAKMLAQSFRNKGLIPPARQAVLVNQQATFANVTGALERIIAQMTSNDTLIFFYSGHGGQTQNADADGGVSESLVLMDNNRQAFAELKDYQLAALLDKCPGRVILIFDSCFAGGFAKECITRPGWIGFFSSQKNVTSLVASKFEAGGYLSYFFQKAIDGDADENADNLVSMNELSRYLNRVWLSSSGPPPSHNQQLVIERNGVGLSDIVFTIK